MDLALLKSNIRKFSDSDEAAEAAVSLGNSVLEAVRACPDDKCFREVAWWIRVANDSQSPASKSAIAMARAAQLSLECDWSQTRQSCCWHAKQYSEASMRACRKLDPQPDLGTMYFHEMLWFKVAE